MLLGATRKLRQCRDDNYVGVGRYLEHRPVPKGAQRRPLRRDARRLPRRIDRLWVGRGQSPHRIETTLRRRL